MTWFLNDAYVDIHLDQWRRASERRALLQKLPRRERGSALRRLRDVLAARKRRTQPDRAPSRRPAGEGA